MPFNSDTFQANKSQRAAWHYIAEAKALKARAARGEAFDWELPRIALLVGSARVEMRLSVFHRRQAAARKARHVRS